MSKLVVFDLDGVLCDNTHRLHFIQGKKKDWDAFFKSCPFDDPIRTGTETARAFNMSGQFMIEFWTARPEHTREDTEEWLREFVGSWTDRCTLRMRQNTDHRGDNLIKSEFIQRLEPSQRPFIIFEDRDRCVEMYRKLGVTVFQTRDGDY